MRNVPLSKIGKWLGAQEVSDAQISGYQIDSRLIEPGEMFFALSGQKTDGHLYLREAAARGAAAAVVSEGYQGEDFGLALVRVACVQESLQRLAHDFMKDCTAKIIGVTGSLGKTTTKEFIATLLEKRFRVGKTLRNFNTKLTYPITLLNRTGEEEVLVVELGMSEPGDIGRLVQIAAPDIAVVTKIAPVHTAFFARGCLDIAKYKAEIFGSEKTKVAIFDHALYGYPEAIEKIHGEKVSFSLEERTADYFLWHDFFLDERGVRAYQFDPPYKQSHILHNMLAAISVARKMGLEWDEINQQVKHLQLPKMRFEVYEREGVTFVNDAYNANPDSMKAALANMPAPKEGGKRIAVLGMMVDLGPHSEEAHREVGHFAQKCVDHLLVLGQGAAPLFDAFAEVKKPAEQYFDYEKLAKRLEELMSPGDVVLLKASRLVAMEQVLKFLA